jgi:hypothetical protein
MMGNKRGDLLNTQGSSSLRLSAECTSTVAKKVRRVTEYFGLRKRWASGIKEEDGLRVFENRVLEDG